MSLLSPTMCRSIPGDTARVFARISFSCEPAAGKESWMEGKTPEKRFRKALKSEDLEQQTKIFYLCDYLLLDSLCNCPYTVSDCHMDFVNNYRKQNAVINRLEERRDKKQKHGPKKVSRHCPHSDCCSCLL